MLISVLRGFKKSSSGKNVNLPSSRNVCIFVVVYISTCTRKDTFRDAWHRDRLPFKIKTEWRLEVSFRASCRPEKPTLPRSCACSLTPDYEGMRSENLTQTQTSPERAAETEKHGLRMNAKKKMCVFIVKDCPCSQGMTIKM